MMTRYHQTDDPDHVHPPKRGPGRRRDDWNDLCELHVAPTFPLRGEYARGAVLKQREAGYEWVRGLFGGKHRRVTGYCQD